MCPSFLMTRLIVAVLALAAAHLASPTAAASPPDNTMLVQGHAAEADDSPQVKKSARRTIYVVGTERRVVPQGDLPQAAFRPCRRTGRCTPVFFLKTGENPDRVFPAVYMHCTCSHEYAAEARRSGEATRARIRRMRQATLAKIEYETDLALARAELVRARNEIRIAATAPKLTDHGQSGRVRRSKQYFARAPKPAGNSDRTVIKTTSPSITAKRFVAPTRQARFPSTEPPRLITGSAGPTVVSPFLVEPMPPTVGPGSIVGPRTYTYTTYRTVLVPR